MEPAVVLVVVLAVLGVPALWLIGTYNGLVRLRKACEAAWATIDAELQRRYDLVPNLVETVRAYAAHERELFERVAAARATAQANHGAPVEQARDENRLVGALGGLFAIAEAYPELRADGQFLALQRELALTEDRIARARRFYNANVQDLNVRVESFPSRLVASAFGIERREHFEIEDHVRVAPRVSP